MMPEFEVESKVRCRNQLWEVIKITDNQDGTWTVRLFPENGGKPKSFLYPHTPIEPIQSSLDRLESGQLDHLDHYRLFTSATRLSLVYEYDKLLSISNSKMIPEPYQLLAVKKVMESLRQRFLIADDVGLGKTIEAGLIMQELTARQRGKRVLIIVPAALQDQWKKEMWHHFHRKFYIYNRHKIEGIQELVDETLNPWLARNSIITSIDWIKPQYEGKGNSRRNNNRVFEQLVKLEKPWDLIIIDEAHYVATDSNRSDLAKVLQEKCDSLLLTTATPHSGQPEHFFNLLTLIDGFRFAHPEDLDAPDARERVDKVMIRRGKETIFEINPEGNLVKKFKERVLHPIEINFSTQEQTLYEAVSHYTATGWANLSRKRKISTVEKNVGKFLLTLVQKRMVSSLYALRETLTRRLNSIVEERTLNKIEGVNVKEIKSLLKDYDREETMEDQDRELVERYLETRKIQAMYANRTKEHQTLRDLLEKTNSLIAQEKDSKYQWIQEFLCQLFAQHPQEKVIIFTEYRDTLNYLKSKLEKEWFLGSCRIVTITGGMPLGENEDEVGSKIYAEKLFNEPETRILLATDAASEGLNLQRHCHILINYELPWNPNKLEQRIGRIHRYGQQKNAQIYNLMIAGSKEAEIFKRLQEKIEVIRRQLGSMADVLGVLERVSLDELILGVLEKSVTTENSDFQTEKEFQKMEKMAKELQKMQFLSGCRQFTQEDVEAAQKTISDAQQAIPTHKDVQGFVETFLRVYGEGKAGRYLEKTAHQGVYRLTVPPVVQDDNLPSYYDRVTFERTIAIKDWLRRDEPEFLAFGHPLLARMVYYCRVTKAAELGGKLSCLVADYLGISGVIFNFILRFEDQLGRVIREELEPVFVDLEGQINIELGRRLYLAPSVPHVIPNQDTIERVRNQIASLKQTAETYIRQQYQTYYQRCERYRSQEINLILEDLDRFDQGFRDFIQTKLRQLNNGQLFISNDFEDTGIKGQRTRLENQLKMHTHRMRERRSDVKKMYLGAFPAPELLNLVIVTPY
jgi:SNF2 family DNA or RNA helicase